MKLDDVLFVGGPWPKFGSVQIRCIDIATYLGCAYVTNVRSLDAVPGNYKAFICVKAKLSDTDLAKLAARGIIIWDLIDTFPTDLQPITSFIVSTDAARKAFPQLQHVEVIYHYHCNFEAVPNDENLRRPTWIGNLHWYPNVGSIEHDVFDAAAQKREDVAAAYRRTGIGLNVRARTNGYENHAILNSGIKLINCIGFGIPSVSEPEPPYLEVGSECTVFTDMAGCAAAVTRLQEEPGLYRMLRNNCLARARDFHISAVADKYRRLIAAL